ncbi:MAG: hypothetical protein IJR90_09615 [Clostridia bacterium]|nr:hypothetical protein [Clostridia bacterium]
MKMKIRIISALAAALILLAGSAGCAGGTVPEETGKDTPQVKNGPHAVGIEFYGPNVEAGVPFYADGEAAYYFHDHSRRFTVKMSDGSELSPEEAFESGKAIPRDLKEFGLDYRKAVVGTDEYETCCIRLGRSEICKTLEEAAFYTGAALKHAVDTRYPIYETEDAAEFFRWVVMPDPDRESCVKEEFEQYRSSADSQVYFIPSTVMESYLTGRIRRYGAYEDNARIIEVEAPRRGEIAGGRIAYPSVYPDETVSGKGKYVMSCYGEELPERGYRVGEAYIPAVCYTFTLTVQLDNGAGDWWVEPGEFYRYRYTKDDVSWLKPGETVLGEVRQNVKPADNKSPRKEMIPSYAQENGTGYTYILLPGESKGQDILLVFTADEVLYEIRYDV